MGVYYIFVVGAWSPQTVLGWYRKLIADKYNSVAPGQKKRGRSGVSPEDEAAIYVKVKDHELPIAEQFAAIWIIATRNNTNKL